MLSGKTKKHGVSFHAYHRITLPFSSVNIKLLIFSSIKIISNQLDFMSYSLYFNFILPISLGHKYKLPKSASVKLLQEWLLSSDGAITVCCSRPESEIYSHIEHWEGASGQASSKRASSASDYWFNWTACVGREREQWGRRGIRVGPGGGGGARGNGCSLPFTPQSLWHQRMKCSSHKLLPWKNWYRMQSWGIFGMHSNTFHNGYTATHLWNRIWEDVR